MRNILIQMRLIATQQKALLCTLVALCFCSNSVSAAVHYLVITNPTSSSRAGEVVRIHKYLLPPIPGAFVPQIRKGKTLYVSQLADEDGDGKWDVLLVEISLGPGATDTLQIEYISNAAAKFFPAFTDVQLSLRSDSDTPSPEIKIERHLRGFVQNIAKPYYQMEGPGIENDKVAFRTFFDVRNGKDIYGKIVDTPVLRRVGVGSSWHELQPWGMDIFRTGASLGAGGLAVKENNVIYRLGDADTTSFMLLYEGPLKAAFRLRFSGWDAGRGKAQGMETMSITKGDFYYQNNIDLSLSDTQSLVAGIADFGSNHLVLQNHHTGFSSLSTYGPQAAGTNSSLGVAILFPASDYRENGTTDSTSALPNTSFVAMKQQEKKTIYFFACWEKTDPRFNTEAGFQQYLQQVAEKLSHPILTKIFTKKS